MGIILFISQSHSYKGNFSPEIKIKQNCKIQVIEKPKSKHRRNKINSLTTKKSKIKNNVC